MGNALDVTEKIGVFVLGVVAPPVQDTLDGSNGTFAVGVYAYFRSSVGDGVNNGAKFGSEYSLVAGAEWLIEVRGVVLRDVDGPTSTSKSVIVRVQEGAVGVNVSVVVIAVSGASVLCSVDGFRFIGDGM